MNEGEFKKQLWRYGFLTEKSLEGKERILGLTPYEQGDYVTFSQVDELLDKAQQKFPKYADFKDVVFQDNLSADFHYILAVTQWRLKYLGGQ